MQLLNISTREHVGTGDNAVIGGFIVSGSADKRVIVRALGPSLADHGIAGPLTDPTLELFDSSGRSLAANDDWKEHQQQEIEESNIAPPSEKEAAIVRTMQPGAYTAVIRGQNETTGVGLVEVYDLSKTTASRLANISTRGFVQTGEDVMIGGFIIDPGADKNAKLLLRALGPSLGDAGVSNPLQDPVLELRDASGTLIARNDNWRDNQAEVAATGIPPTSDTESALVTRLAPGNYTVIVHGRDGGTGVGLVEAFGLE